MAAEPEILREQAASIVRSGALGRSRSYARLLEFLVECAHSGRTPKELEIAMEVFGRGADFDPSQDSMVRVYAHNLRQKLEHYYATTGRNEPRQLLLARGEYRISLAESDEPAEPVEAAVVVAPPAPELAAVGPAPPEPLTSSPQPSAAKSSVESMYRARHPSMHTSHRTTAHCRRSCAAVEPRAREREACMPSAGGAARPSSR